MNVRESAAVLLLLMRAYPNTTIQDGTEQVWADALKNVEFEAVAEAVKEYIKDEEFWPSIAAIRRIIRNQHDRQRTPYVMLPSGEGDPTIQRHEWTTEELEAMRAERRRVLDGLRNEGGNDATGE